MTDLLQLSAKNLGQMSLPTFCGRCFWLRVHNPQMPFQIFPSIFSAIDSFSKRITNLYFQRHGRLPNWFQPIGLDARPLETRHWSKFNYVDTGTNIRLTGAADEILKLPGRSGALAIVDYKTARHTTRADELAPMYKTQLACYSAIAQHIGMGQTKSLWLAYYEPLSGITSDQLADLVDDDSVAMRFAPKLVPVEMNQAIIPKLLKRARKIHDGPMPGRTEGCRDCNLLEELLRTVRRGQGGLPTTLKGFPASTEQRVAR